jgi:hypothetical protein
LRLAPLERARLELARLELARLELARLELARRADDRAGTLPPSRRASERPIAIACRRLLTRLLERPDLRVPRFISCMARPTFVLALRP